MVGIPPPKKSGLKSMAMKAKLEHKDQCKTEKARLKAEKVSRTAATKKAREEKTDAKFQKKKKGDSRQVCRPPRPEILHKLVGLDWLRLGSF